MSIKFTNEPPQGLKAGLKRTYNGKSLSKKTMEGLILGMGYRESGWWPSCRMALMRRIDFPDSFCSVHHVFYVVLSCPT